MVIRENLGKKHNKEREAEPAIIKSFILSMRNTTRKYFNKQTVTDFHHGTMENVLVTAYQGILFLLLPWIKYT